MRSGQSQHFRFRPRGIMLAVAVSLMACADDADVAAPPVARADIEEVALALTPSLAADLLPRGHLTTPRTTLPQDGISEERAVELATALVKQFASIFRPTIERQAGRAVDLDDLTLDRRVIFAETPHRPLPDDHENWLKAWAGPAYIVTFTDRHGPAVAVSVSAYAKAVAITNDRLTWPARSGNEFRMIGIDSKGRYGPVFTAEAAAVKAHERFGARVATAPSFVRRGVGWMPFVGAWRVPLERAVQANIQGRGTRSVSVVYLEPDGSFTAPIGPGSAVVRSMGGSRSSLTVLPRADIGGARAIVTARAAGGGQ